MDRKSQGITRAIKEVMFIRVNNLTLNRNLSTSCHIFWMGCCRTFHLSIYSDTPPFLHPHQSHKGHPLQGAHTHCLGKYGPPRVSPHIHIGAKFSCPILAPILVTITFSLRPEEALLVVTLQKLVSLKKLYSVLL